MATPQQIEANRKNSQNSTGATSETGKQRSSLNATRHCFTGQPLVLSDVEKEAYEFNVLAYMDEYSPKTQIESDLNRSLHQIAVQQHNLMSLINAMTEQLMKQGDLEALSKALAQPYRTLNTLGIYESRKRGAANAVLAQLTAMLESRREALAQAAKLYKQHKALNLPFVSSEFGFVHSATEMERELARESANSPKTDKSSTVRNSL